jgi:hypothetical protein
MSNDGPHCPECGEPIGQTATYCMHCSADLTEEREAADTDDDGAWETATASVGGAESGTTGTGDTTTAGGGADGGEAEATAGSVDAPSFDDAAGGGQLLDPEGLVDNSLTVVVGIAGGVVIGLVGTFVLLIMTGSLWSLGFGFLAWLVATAHLVRRRTVQGAISRSAYGVSVVLLLVPLTAVSPLSDGGLEERVAALVGLLLAVAFPAGIAAGIGWLASRFVPEDGGHTG